MKLGILATDFVYAIVVGAAFGRFQEPEFTLGNILLLGAFVVIMDDWIIYHAQMANIQDDAALSAPRLGGDVLVLLVWYWTALIATKGDPAKFALSVAAFYAVTALSELLFGFYRQLGGRGGAVVKRLPGGLSRVWNDCLSAAYFVLAAFLVFKGWLPMARHWMIAMLLMSVLLRIPVWRFVTEEMRYRRYRFYPVAPGEDELLEAQGGASQGPTQGLKRTPGGAA